MADGPFAGLSLAELTKQARRLGGTPRPPMSRMRVEDLIGVHLSPGTLARIAQECARRLQPTDEQLRQAVRAAGVVHFDETGLSIKGKLS